MEQRERRAKAKKWVIWVPSRDTADKYHCRNTGLLSFGDSEEIPEEAVTIKKKSMTRQDCELGDPMTICT